jgi:hypothetical protein
VRFCSTQDTEKGSAVELSSKIFLFEFYFRHR